MPNYDETSSLMEMGRAY